MAVVAIAKRANLMNLTNKSFLTLKEKNVETRKIKTN